MAFGCCTIPEMMAITPIRRALDQYENAYGRASGTIGVDVVVKKKLALTPGEEQFIMQ
jgi:hypothetical protein